MFLGDPEGYGKQWGYRVWGWLCDRGSGRIKGERESATDAICWVVERPERSTLASDFDGRIWE